MTETLPQSYDDPHTLMADLAYSAGYVGIEDGDTERYPEKRDSFNAVETHEMVEDLFEIMQEQMGTQETLPVDYSYFDSDELRFHTWRQYYGSLPESLNAQGPVVEIGGPTREDSNVLTQELRPDFVSNLKRRPMGLDGNELDFEADGRNMPLADESVGGVAVHSMNGSLRMATEVDGMPAEEVAELREKVIDEAVRVTKPEGYVVWGQGTIVDFDDFVKHGMKPVFVESVVTMNQKDEDTFFQPGLTVNAVFQKPAQPHETA